ncbi:hypothetical protein GCM10027418_27180 [Mariniluteicoccus endophyticus]
MTTFAPRPVAGEPADERDLRRQIKDWRTGRATRTLWEALQDAYVVVLSVLVLGSMLIALIVQAQGDAATCTTAACQSARSLLPYAALATSVALSVAAARLFGPVLASAPEGFWLLDAPIDRARLLRGRLMTAVSLAAVLGAVLPPLVAALAGSPVPLIVAWGVAGVLSCAAIVAFSAFEQTAERTLATRVLTYLFAIAAVAALGAVVGIAAGWFSFAIAAGTEMVVAVAVAGVSAVVLGVTFVAAWSRLRRLRRTRLVSGGSLVSGMAGAMYALDLGLARDIVIERNARERGHVRSRAGSGTGIDALVRRDLSRLLRTPQAFLPVLGSLVVPYAAAALGFGKFVPLVAGLFLFWALIPLLGSLRVLTRTVGLARCLPFDQQQIMRASMTVAAAVAAVWGLLVVPAFVSTVKTPTDAITYAMLTAVAGLLGAVRWTIAKPVDYGAPMLATQAGAMPPGLIGNMVRGFDMVIAITIPLLFGLPWLISVLVAGICYWFALGNFDMEKLQEQQAEQKRLLEEERKKREELKTKK